MSEKTENMDMLQGSLTDKILAFALPLAATGILQQLFNAADVAVVGQYAGKNAMAAVGSNSPIIGLLVNAFVGIALGANVVISRFTGQKNSDGVQKAVHTSVVFAVFSGFALMLFGELIAPFLLRLLSVPDEIFPLSLLYLRVYLLGLPVIFLYNFESAVFRSQGDTRTPLICLVISGVINVALNLFFVRVLGMSVDGVATATVISNLISSAMLFVLLCRRHDSIRLQIQKLQMDQQILAAMVRIGLPAGLQGMVFSVSNLCIQSAINQLGADVMAASSAAFNIEIFAYYVINSFGQACTTFVGQNYGAGNIDRCRRVARISLVLDFAITAVICVLLMVFGRPLLGLFNRDPAVASIGMIRLRYIVSAEVINVVMEVMSGAMRGYGYSLVPAIITFAGVCGIRITWVYTVFRTSQGFHTLMMVYPISWAVTAAALCIAYLLFLRRFRGTGAQKQTIS